MSSQLKKFLTVIATLALVTLAMGLYHLRESKTAGLRGANIPIESVSLQERQRTTASLQLRSLASMAAPFNRANFGPGATTVFYRKPLVISDAFSTPDRSLFAIIVQNSPPGSQADFYYLALLNAGNLQQLQLPRVGTAIKGYNSMHFSADSRANEPIIRAFDYDGHEYYYAVRLGQLRAILHASPEGFDQATLVSGERCAADANPASPVAVFALSYNGSRRPLVSKNALLNGSHGLLDARVLQSNTVRCYHFGNQDLLNVGDAENGVVFGLNGGTPTLRTVGQVMVSGKHILIKLEEADNNTYIDYLEVFIR